VPALGAGTLAARQAGWGSGGVVPGPGVTGADESVGVGSAWSRRAVSRLTATAALTTTAATAATAETMRPSAMVVSLPSFVTMVTEVAIIDVQDGTAEQFLTAYRGVRDIVRDTPGCRSLRMTHGIEQPTRFVLLIEWDSVQAHEENFRSTDRFQQWRAAIGPYFAHPPLVEHFEDAD
jgi:heme-degrading monooxygenase HmoA